MTDMKTALTVEFSPEFMTAVGNTLSMYDKALDQLQALVNGNGFTDDYGMCNTKYHLVYITPKDIASYVDYVFKAVSRRLIGASIGDLEKFSVTMAKQFMEDNCKVDTSRGNIFAKSAYADPRVQTMMDLLVQTENTFFDRCAFSKFEMIERARLMKKDYETMNALHLKPTLTAVIKSLPDVIKEQWKDARCFDTFTVAAIMSYVETFILFTVSLNLATLEQMIGYAQPIATFIRKDKNPRVTQESATDPAKSFVEYFTECCFINTNDIRMRMRVPFDFNLKNIVLQDQTNGFKETRTAIHFMIRDNRSPIRAYLLKYTTKRNLNDRLEFDPILNLLKPYFHPENIDAAKYEYEKLSFHTDLNWISRIAFNNQFSDGDYRTDGLGNDARSPIVQTLSMLERMYCGCTLKTNEELANHICTLASLMNTILEHDCGLCNRDYIRDVLAVLGECFTKCVIRLFNNNATAVIYTDDMPDTMVPGITYCEQFVYVEADGNQQQQQGQQQNNANASGISFSQNTQEKTGGLSKVKTMLRQFLAWIMNTLKKVPLLFARTNGQRAEFVAKHDELNKAIGAAMGGTNPFQVNCKNVPIFQIPLKDLLSEMDKWDPEIKAYLNAVKASGNQNATNDAKLAELRSVLYPGIQNNISKTILSKEGDERKKAIEEYLLFSRVGIQPGDPACYKNGLMDVKTWTNICECLKGTPKLLEEFSNKAAKALEQYVKAIDTQNPEGEIPDELVNLLKEVQEFYITPAVNIYSSKMFDVYYKYYKSIVDNYNVQYKTSQSKVDQQASEVAQSTNAAQQQQTKPKEG